MSKEVEQLIAQELERQRNSINLIPSENYASKAVLRANGSVLTNKYSEGMINKRYYPGNEIVDQENTFYGTFSGRPLKPWP